MDYETRPPPASDRIFRLKRKYRSLRTPSLDALMRNSGEMQRLYVHDAQRAWNDMVANAIALDLPEMKGKLGFLRSELAGYLGWFICLGRD